MAAGYAQGIEAQPRHLTGAGSQPASARGRVSYGLRLAVMLRRSVDMMDDLPTLSNVG